MAMMFKLYEELHLLFFKGKPADLLGRKRWAEEFNSTAHSIVVIVQCEF